MKKGLTEVVFIIDKSGSMHDLTKDTINGFNSMIEKYKEECEMSYVTTVLFAHDYTKLHDHVNITDVNPMTKNDYFACGSTALLDAVGKTIDDVGVRLFETTEEERPEKVIFVIITDGEENESEVYSRSKVKEMIEHQQEKYSWGFLFLGANIDAEEEAGSIGINREFAATYSANSVGLTSAYDAMADSLYCMSCCDDIRASAASVKAVLDAKVYNDNIDVSSSKYSNDTISGVCTNAVNTGTCINVGESLDIKDGLLNVSDHFA